MNETKQTPLKRISQLYVEHENGQPPEVVEIVIPIEQVVVDKDASDEENLLTLMSWGKF